MSEPNVVSWYTGTARFVPPAYTVVEKINGPWWWRRTEYWLETEFSKLGPMSKAEAVSFAASVAACGSKVTLPPSLLGVSP